MRDQSGDHCSLFPRVNLCCPVLMSYSSIASLDGQQCASSGPQRWPVKKTDAPSTWLIRPKKLISAISAFVTTSDDPFCVITRCCPCPLPPLHIPLSIRTALLVPF